MKRLVYLFLFLLVAVFTLTLNIQNPQLVSLNYYFNVHWEAPLALLLMATFIIGLICGWLLMTWSVVKNKRQVGRANKKLAKVEREVENLRTMPIKDNV
jgi:putative membrane protein